MFPAAVRLPSVLPSFNGWLGIGAAWQLVHIITCETSIEEKSEAIEDGGVPAA